MTINFIPNDPSAKGGDDVRTIKPSRDPAQNRCGFTVSGKMPDEKAYKPGTPEFTVWQCREAALLALTTFESWCGPLSGWRGDAGVKRLPLKPIKGMDLNADYDRAAVNFYQYEIDGRVIYTGDSTDVVAHEVGHAILDALRPDLWDAMTLEPGAFHEGFGDCISIMTALADKPTRTALLKASPKLDKGNFVEAFGEALSRAIKAVQPASNAAAARRGLNRFKWQLPQTLPQNGPPTMMIQEEHSMGQLLSGCYYDLIRELFSQGPQTDAGLLRSARLATQLLAQSVAKAPIVSRFFQSVGRTMLVVDQDQNGAANVASIKAAYENHGIDIGAATFLSPSSVIGGAAAGGGRRGVRAAGIVSVTEKRNLRAIVDAPDIVGIRSSAVTLGGQNLTMASALRAVDLTGISERLAGVVAMAPQSALLGAARGGRRAVLGAVESSGVVTDEVHSYVGLLVRRGAIDFGDAKPKAVPKAAAKAAKPRKKAKLGRAKVAAKRKAGRAGPGAVFLPGAMPHTHEIVLRRDGQKELRRRTFACRCCQRPI